MALTPEQIDALPEYTTAQQLKLWRYTLADLATKPNIRGVDGNNYTEKDISKIQSIIKDLEAKLAAEGAGVSGFGNVLVRVKRG